MVVLPAEVRYFINTVRVESPVSCVLCGHFVNNCFKGRPRSLAIFLNESQRSLASVRRCTTELNPGASEHFLPSHFCHAFGPTCFSCWKPGALLFRKLNSFGLLVHSGSCNEVGAMSERNPAAPSIVNCWCMTCRSSCQCSE